MSFIVGWQLSLESGRENAHASWVWDERESLHAEKKLLFFLQVAVSRGAIHKEPCVVGSALFVCLYGELSKAYTVVLFWLGGLGHEDLRCRAKRNG